MQIRRRVAHWGQAVASEDVFRYKARFPREQILERYLDPVVWLAFCDDFPGEFDVGIGPGPGADNPVVQSGLRQLVDRLNRRHEFELVGKVQRLFLTHQTNRARSLPESRLGRGQHHNGQDHQHNPRPDQLGQG